MYVRGRGRGRYICDRCGIRCKKPSMLKKHIKYEANEFEFLTDLLDNSISLFVEINEGWLLWGTLILFRSHTDVRAFNCTACNFSFKTKGNLTKHLSSKTHQRRISNSEYGRAHFLRRMRLLRYFKTKCIFSSSRQR